MKYVGIYWSLFASMIKKSIRTRFGYFLVLPFENMDFARNGGYDRSLS